MICTCTPFRISFAGGGSDFKGFYEKHPGCVVSTSINKYMYLIVHPFYDRRILVKYSKTELVNAVEEINHPIVREALRLFNLESIEINSIADIPAGTGLGSSCSFTVGLLHALNAYRGRYASKEELAARACEIEIDILGEPIGKQDQYAAAFGGLNFITFHPNGQVQVEPIPLPAAQYHQLQDNLLMFSTGDMRPARDILSDQKKNIEQNPAQFTTLVRMTELARSLRQSLTQGRIADMGPILDENWQLKKGLADKISDGRIDAYYAKALANGATGGKLLGAGGGGFLLFYCEPEHQDKLRRALPDLRELEFRFDTFGSRVIFYENN